MNAPKVKVSLTLSPDVLALVDRDAEVRGDTRSGVVDSWLRRAAAGNAAAAIHEATAKYYQSLTAEDARDNDAWARASTKAAKAVTYESVAKAKPSRKRR